MVIFNIFYFTKTIHAASSKGWPSLAQLTFEWNFLVTCHNFDYPRLSSSIWNNKFQAEFIAKMLCTAAAGMQSQAAGDTDSRSAVRQTLLFPGIDGICCHFKHCCSSGHHRDRSSTEAMTTAGVWCRQGQIQGNFTAPPCVVTCDHWRRCEGCTG